MTANANAQAPTEVNSAIMAAADQILAGLKGGKLFSASSSGPGALPIGQIGVSMCETAAANYPKNDVRRCSPTGVNQNEQCADDAKVTTSTFDYPKDANCVSQSSQVTFEESNSDLNKIASASSLTSSEHSHGDRVLVEVAGLPMQQVTFSSKSEEGAGTGGGGGTKRQLSPLSGDAGTEGPPSQRQRLSTCVTPGQEGRQPVQAGEPWTQKQTKPQQPQQGGQVSVQQPTFQPILPAPRTASHRDQGQPSVPAQNQPLYHQSQDQPYAAIQAPEAHQARTKGPCTTHGSIEAATASQGRATAPAELPAVAPLAPTGRAYTQIPAPQVAAQGHEVLAPENQSPVSEAQGTAPSQVPLAAAYAPLKIAPLAQTPAAPIAPRQAPRQLESYYSHIQLPTQVQGQAATPVPIAPAPTPNAKEGQCQESFYGQGHPPPVVPIAPAQPTTAPLRHQESLPCEIQPRLPVGQTGQNSHQKLLPPIYPRPCPTLQRHGHPPQPQAHHEATQPQKQGQPQHPPVFAYNYGMPAIPRTSQIDSSSIQLEHMDHKQQGHVTTMDSTATFAAAPSPNTFTQHQPTHGAQHQSHAATGGLRCPAFPGPPAASTAVRVKSVRTPSPDVASNLRNQRMQPTDCLLFAASLLQDVPAVPAPPAAQAIPVADNAPVYGVGASVVTGQYQPPQYPHVLPQQIHAAQEISASPSPAATGTASLQLPVYPVLPPAAAHSPQDQPRDLDVLCGRGGLINKHTGNIIYRRVVEHNKPFYQSVQKRHRILVSQSIVHTILNRGGRFLSEDTKTTHFADGTRSTVTVWKPVAPARAIQKTSQALRERVADSSKSKSGETSEEGKADFAALGASNSAV